MLQHGQGVVLRSVKYGDSGLIVTVFTPQHGLTALVVQGIYGKKARIKPSMLQALSLIECVYYYKDGRNVHRLKEVKCRPVLHQIQSDYGKTATALFCAEVLYKSLKAHGSDAPLFEMVQHLVLQLENSTIPTAFFPQHFLLKLAEPLGFSPQWGNGTYFYLHEGVFSNLKPAKGIAHLSVFDSAVLRDALKQSYPETRVESRKLLYNLLEYYQYQVAQFGELNSLGVLQSLANG